jgi:hypothetical protein
LSVVVSEDDFYDENILVPEPIRFEMVNDALTFSLLFGFESTDERVPQQVVRTLVEPLLRRHRMSILDLAVPTTDQCAFTVEIQGSVIARSCGARHFLRTNAYNGSERQPVHCRPTSPHMADIGKSRLSLT